MVTARKFNDSIKKLETIDVSARQLTAIELLAQSENTISIPAPNS